MSARVRTTALFRGLASLAVLVGLLAGVPLALAAGVGSPLPKQMPSLDEISTALSDTEIPDAFLIKAMAFVCWVAWFFLAFCILVEIVAALRGRQAKRVPLAGPVQPMVSKLVSAILLSTSLGRPLVAAAIPLSAVVARAAPAVAEVQEQGPVAPAPGARTGTSTSTSTTSTTQPATARAAAGTMGLQPATEVAAPAAAEKTYTVVPGDTLWDICERHLNDPYRWTELFEMNRGRQQPDGRWLRNPNLIRPGWTLQMPNDAVGLDAASVVAEEVPAPERDGATPPASTTTTTPPPTTTTTPPPPTTTEAPATTTTTTPPPETTTTTEAPEERETAAPLIGRPAPPPPTTLQPPSTSTTTTTVAPVSGEAPVPPAPGPGDPLAPVPSTSVPASTTTTAPAPPEADDGSLNDALPIRFSGGSLAGAGLLGAGVLGLLQKMRRSRSRQRRPGGPVEVAEPELAGTELALRVGADPAGAEFIDLALRAMAAGLKTEAVDIPDVVALQLRNDELELLLATPQHEVPPWFTARDHGNRWVLPRSTDLGDLRDAAYDTSSPLPALITAGHLGDGSRLLVDLEEGGLTSVPGDPQRARELLCSVASELATSRWSDYVSLILVGFGGHLRSLERVRVVASVAEVIDELEAEAADIGRVLADAGCSSTLEARVRGLARDTWTPTLLVAGNLPVPMAKRLAALTSKAGNAGVAALVAGDVADANWRLVMGEDTLTVEPLGLKVEPQGITPEEAESMGELLEDAWPPEAAAEPVDEDDFAWGVRPDEHDPRHAQVELALPVGAPDDLYWDLPPVIDETSGLHAPVLEAPAHGDTLDVYDEPPAAYPDPLELDDAVAGGNGYLAGAAGLEPDVEASVPAERQFVVVRNGASDDDVAAEPAPVLAPSSPSVEVGVLGPVEIRGAGPMPRSKSQELIVYLSLHPGAAVGADRLMEALWPGRPPNGPNLNVTTSQARTALGQAPDGSYYLPRVGGDRIYRLSPEVGLDYSRFAEMVTSARGLDADVARALLRSALELVRGRAFEVAGRGYEWAHAEGIITHIDAAVADAAHWLARLSLNAGDAEGARWAAERGLRASPGNEQLYRDLMQAADLNGNPAGVEALMDELCRQVEDDEPYGHVHPETLALYEQLTRSGARHKVGAR